MNNNPEKIKSIISELEDRISSCNSEIERKVISDETKKILITERKTYKSILNIIYDRFPELRES